MKTARHTQPQGYQIWLVQLKTQIQSAQQRAALAVNAELIGLYWQIGHDILQRQMQQGWGASVIDTLALDLSHAFPELKGFSVRNLKYMRAFAECWPDFEQNPIVQQAVAQLAQALPHDFEQQLPSIERIEQALGHLGDFEHKDMTHATAFKQFDKDK